MKSKEAEQARQNGFTIMELSIVLFIIVMLSSILYVGAREQTIISQVIRASYQVSQDLRETEEKAMGADAVDCGGFESRVFGINFHKTAGNWEKGYTIFADCDDDYQFDRGIVDKVIEYIDKEGEITALTVIIPGVPNWWLVNDVDIVFEPPEPKVFINNAVSGKQAEIYLVGREGGNVGWPSGLGAVLLVRINNIGRIEVERIY